VTSFEPGRPPRRPRQGRGPDRRDDYGRGRKSLRPRPLGDKCNPLCPFFRCSKRALRIGTEQYKGRSLRVAMCAWIGDKCIGPSCRFAYCEKRAMLPDGRCALAVKASKQKDFEEELMEVEKESKKFGYMDEYF